MTETNRGKTKTATEFFAEKFADGDEETEPIWIDPKGESDESSEHRFVAGQTGAGKTTKLVGILDDEGESDDVPGGDG
jgi:type IV secretory pathway VirB4 component